MANEPLFVGVETHLAHWVNETYYDPALSQSVTTLVLESSQITEDNGLVTIPQDVTVTGSLTAGGKIDAIGISAGSLTGSLAGDASQLTGYRSNLIQLSQINGNQFSSSVFYFPHNVDVRRTITVTEVHTEYATGSIIYASGSTKFGENASNTHTFTGSLYASDIVESNGPIVARFLSGDGSQITDLSRSSIPNTVVYTDQSNIFTRNQSINGSVSASNNLTLNRLHVADASYFEISRTGMTAGTSSIHIVSQSDARCCFMDFVIASGSSARLAASVSAAWVNGQLDHMETETPDVGDVSNRIRYECTLDDTFINLTIFINSGVWNIKGIVRTI